MVENRNCARVSAVSYLVLRKSVPRVNAWKLCLKETGREKDPTAT